jgi:hypothetical protein
MNVTEPPTTHNVIVEVTPDLLTAFLKLEPAVSIDAPCETAPVDALGETAPVDALGETASTKVPGEEHVFAALQEAGINITDAVKARVAEFLDRVSSSSLTSEPFVVAKGRLPRHGRDEKFEWDKSFEEEAIDWQGDAPINYYTLNSIVTVGKDVVIGKTIPAVQPRDGVDLKGKKIPAGGSELPLKFHESVRRSPDDPSRVISNIPGRVVEKNQTLAIVEVLTIAGDIGFDTGNVDCTVDVNVAGAIPDCFEAESERSITVGTSIEAAKVTAAGDVVVRLGVLGRRTGLVTAGGEIVVKFASEANLVAGGDIKIGAQLMNSFACAGGKLLAVGAHVIGGSLYVQNDVEVAQLGSEANIPTRIVVGVKPEVIREAAAIHTRVGRVRQLIDRIDELLRPLLHAREPLSDAQEWQVSQLLARTDDAQARIAKDEEKLSELLKNVYTPDPPTVQVTRIIYNRVTVRIGDRETVFHGDFAGPVSLERRKIDNITELVAVNNLTASLKILTSQRRPIDELLRDFELERSNQENASG